MNKQNSIPIAIGIKIQNSKLRKSRIWNLEFGIWNFIATTLFITSFTLTAQPTQPARYEREHKGSDHDFLVISMGEKGLALVRDTEKVEKYKKEWEVIFLDTALQESWKTKLEIGHRMNILGYEFRDGNIYLLFEEPDNLSKEINLTEI